MQSTRSNEPASTGSSSTGPRRSACGFSTTSTPTYSRAVAKNGRYGLTPQPTSRTRSPAASRPSASSQRARGARTAQDGRPRLGFPPPRSLSRIDAARDDGEPEGEPRQRLEWDAGDDPHAVPRADGDEDPPSGDERRSPRRAHGEREAGCDRSERECEPDDAQVCGGLDPEVLDAPFVARRRIRERRL